MSAQHEDAMLDWVIEDQLSGGPEGPWDDDSYWIYANEADDYRHEGDDLYED